jgi:hypothetical protein
VESVSGDHAQISLGAFSARGSVYTGPLLAARVDGGWRVEDYVDGGRDIRQSIVTSLRADQDRGGIQIRAVGLWMPNRSGDLWMIVTNHSGAPVKAVGLTISGPSGTVSSSQGLSPNMGLIQPQAAIMTDMGWAPHQPLRPGQRYVVHPLFVNLSTGERTQFDLLLKIPRNN